MPPKKRKIETSESDEEYGAPKKKKQKKVKKITKKELAKKELEDRTALLNSNVVTISKLGTLPNDTMSCILSFIPAYPFLFTLRRVNKWFSAIITNVVFPSTQVLYLFPQSCYQYYKETELFFKEKAEREKSNVSKNSKLKNRNADDNDDEDMSDDKSLVSTWKPFPHASHLNSKQPHKIRLLKHTEEVLTSTFPNIHTLYFFVSETFGCKSILQHTTNCFPKLETLYLMTKLERSYLKYDFSKDIIPATVKKLVLFNFDNVKFETQIASVETYYCNKIPKNVTALVKKPNLSLSSSTSDDKEVLEYFKFFKEKFNIDFSFFYTSGMFNYLFNTLKRAHSDSSVDYFINNADIKSADVINLLSFRNIPFDFVKQVITLFGEVDLVKETEGSKWLNSATNSSYAYLVDLAKFLVDEIGILLDVSNMKEAVCNGKEELVKFLVEVCDSSFLSFEVKPFNYSNQVETFHALYDGIKENVPVSLIKFLSEQEYEKPIDYFTVFNLAFTAVNPAYLNFFYSSLSLEDRKKYTTAKHVLQLQHYSSTISLLECIDTCCTMLGQAHFETLVIESQVLFHICANSKVTLDLYNKLKPCFCLYTINASKTTPLHTTSHEYLLDLFKGGVDPNMEDENGVTLAMLSVTYQHKSKLNALLYLLENKYNVEKADKKFGNNTLHYLLNNMRISNEKEPIQFIETLFKNEQCKRAIFAPNQQMEIPLTNYLNNSNHYYFGNADHAADWIEIAEKYEPGFLFKKIGDVFLIDKLFHLDSLLDYIIKTSNFNELIKKHKKITIMHFIAMYGRATMMQVARDGKWKEHWNEVCVINERSETPLSYYAQNRFYEEEINELMKLGFTLPPNVELPLLLFDTLHFSKLLFTNYTKQQIAKAFKLYYNTRKYSNEHSHIMRVFSNVKDKSKSWFKALIEEAVLAKVMADFPNLIQVLLRKYAKDKEEIKAFMSALVNEVDENGNNCLHVFVQSPILVQQVKLELVAAIISHSSINEVKAIMEAKNKKNETVLDTVKDHKSYHAALSNLIYPKAVQKSKKKRSEEDEESQSQDTYRDYDEEDIENMF